jgi:hypothetical protein
MPLGLHSGNRLKRREISPLRLMNGPKNPRKWQFSSNYARHSMAINDAPAKR